MSFRTDKTANLKALTEHRVVVYLEVDIGVGIFGGATVHPKASGEPPAGYGRWGGEVAQLNYDPYITSLQPTVQRSPIDFSFKLGLDEVSYIVPNVVVPASMPTSAYTAPQ